MIFGNVVGTVVATQRGDDIPGAKFLLVETCTYKGKAQGSFHVALDVVGAGVGEMVLLAQGSSARQTEMSEKKPIDAVIVGIIDGIEEKGTIVFRK